MTPQDLALPTVGRWLGLVALAIVIGGFALELLVLPRDAADLTTARRRLRRWMALAVAVLVVASVGDLVARARVMSGGNFLEAMAALPLVLTRTHFGTIWIARALALVLLVMVSRSRAVPSRATGLVLSLAVALSLSLTGHAADWGDYSFSVLVDWLHAVAATSWTGGLFGLALTMCRHRPAWPTELVGVVARRFSRLAGYCLLVVVASGVYNSWVQVPSFAALGTTTYGVTLLLKIALSLVLTLLGAINRYRVLPGLNAGGEVTDRLSRLVTREAVLAVVVFGCTAVLAESTPKSHEDYMPHAATGTGRSIYTESARAAQRVKLTTRTPRARSPAWGTSVKKGWREPSRTARRAPAWRRA